MVTFVKLNKEDRERLFKDLKEEKGSSWEDIYPEYGVSRATFFNYMSGRYGVPQKIFLQIKEDADIEISDYEEVERQRCWGKEIEKLTLDNDLAEVLGILNGDGCLSPCNYEISVTLDSQEEAYIEYVKNLLEKVFELEFKLRELKNAVQVKTYSKDLIKRLNEKYSLPVGEKIGSLEVPLVVRNSQEFSKCYIRGLFDTDGCVYLKRKNQPSIEIVSKDPNFLGQIKEVLESLGFKAGISGKNLYLYKQGSASKFFKNINPANKKHIKRFEEII